MFSHGDISVLVMLFKYHVTWKQTQYMAGEQVEVE